MHDSVECAAGLGCPAAQNAKIVVANLDSPPGDDQVTLKGEFTITPPLDPLTTGVRLLVDNAEVSRRSTAP
jgi:hypothetical protein